MRSSSAPHQRKPTHHAEAPNITYDLPICDPRKTERPPLIHSRSILRTSPGDTKRISDQDTNLPILYVTGTASLILFSREH